MHTFIEHNIPELEQINLPHGRFYKTLDGNLYPSVTTVLGSIPNPHLDSWRKKLGDVEADKYSKLAAERGTRIHEACENYLLGKEYTFSMYRQAERQMFKNIVPYLDNVTEVHGLEKRVYSDKLRVAGTIDLVAKIDGKLYIADFKTSGRYKGRAEIDSYFMQCAAYALAWHERTGMLIPDIKIIITTEDDGVLVYDEKVKDWIGKFVEIRNLL